LMNDILFRNSSSPYRLIFIVLLILINTLNTFSEEQKIVDIFVLGTGNNNAPWSESFESGLNFTLDSNNIRYNLFTEYLDVGSFNEKNQFDLMEFLLSTKYEKINPQFLVTTGPSASHFLKDNFNLFPESLKIGIRNNFEDIKNYDYYFSNNNKYAEIVSEMLRLSGADSVYVVANNDTESYAFQYNDFLSELKKEDVGITVFLNMNMDDLIESVKSLPPKSVLFCLPVAKRRGDEILNPREVVSQLNKVSSSPIFADSEIILGYGIVGGYLSSPFDLGKSVGEIIISEINGYKIEKKRATLYLYAYDWNELEKWDLTTKARKDGVFINKPLKNTLVFTRWQIVLFFILLFFLLFMTRLVFLIFKKKKLSTQSPFIALSDRELEVAKKIYHGVSLKEIAYDL
jgi:hypothetical protein